MEFFKRPKDNSHKKIMWLIFVLLIVIGLSFLWQFIGEKASNLIPEKRIEIDPKGSLTLPDTYDVSLKKVALFARIAKIESEPLTPYEKNLILGQFGDANSMNLTTEEKATILEALNRQQ